MNVIIIKPKTIFGKAQYQLMQDAKILGINIPKGFITDGATSPRFLWPIIPPISTYLEATILHDYLLTQGINRYRCDCIFKRAAKTYGVNKTVTKAMYYAIVAYGFTKKPKDYLKNAV